MHTTCEVSIFCCLIDKKNQIYMYSSEDDYNTVLKKLVDNNYNVKNFFTEDKEDSNISEEIFLSLEEVNSQKIDEEELNFPLHFGNKNQFKQKESKSKLKIESQCKIKNLIPKGTRNNSKKFSHKNLYSNLTLFSKNKFVIYPGSNKKPADSFLSLNNENNDNKDISTINDGASTTANTFFSDNINTSLTNNFVINSIGSILDSTSYDDIFDNLKRSPDLDNLRNFIKNPLYKIDFENSSAIITPQKSFSCYKNDDFVFEKEDY